MPITTVTLLLGTLATLPAAIASVVYTRSSKATKAFFNPVDGGGSWLDDAGVGVGEPLNVVISGFSSPDVLTDDGLLNYARAIGFSEECFGIHLGAPQSADLGDGHGPVNQTIELRQDFGLSGVGTCFESLVGGNHFRVYRQNGPLANSGALFLAVSKEQNVFENHNIVPDGYNIGRDLLVTAANGTTSFGGVTYTTRVERMANLMASGSVGVNHGIAVDGTVVLLTVTIDT